MNQYLITDYLVKKYTDEFLVDQIGNYCCELYTAIWMGDDKIGNLQVIHVSLAHEYEAIKAELDSMYGFKELNKEDYLIDL